jgi:hypothetical protein
MTCPNCGSSDVKTSGRFMQAGLGLGGLVGGIIANGLVDAGVDIGLAILGQVSLLGLLPIIAAPLALFCGIAGGFKAGEKLDEQHPQYYCENCKRSWED